MVDYNEFAEKFKAKNPAYADRDNRTLAEALIKKHPEYADRVTFDNAAQQEQTQEQPQEPQSMLGTMKQVGTSVAKSAFPEIATAVDAFNSPASQPAKDLSEMPMRGLRGIGTGLVSGLQRASEATQPGYVPETTGEKVADIGAGLLDPRGMAAAVGPLGKAAEGAAAVGSALETSGAKAINKAIQLRPKTLASLMKSGENPVDAGVRIGKELMDIGVDIGSDKKMYDTAIKARKVSGKNIGQIYDTLKKEGVYAEIMPANEALQPVFDKLNQLNSAATSAVKVRAKPFQEVFDHLLDKASKQGNQLHINDIRKVIKEIGPLVNKGDEATQEVMGELYGTLAKARDSMVEYGAKMIADDTLKTALLAENRKYSMLSKIMPDIKQVGLKSGVGKGKEFSLLHPLDTGTDVLGPSVAKGKIKIGRALQTGFPSLKDDKTLQNLLAKLKNQKGEISLGGQNSMVPGMEKTHLNEMWGNMAKAQGVKQKTISEFVHPEQMKLPIISPAEIKEKIPYAIYRGKGFGGEFYDIYNSPLNSKSNVRVTLSGENAIEQMKKHGIPVVGRLKDAK